MSDIEKLIQLGLLQKIESKIDIEELILPEKQKNQILYILHEMKTTVLARHQMSITKSGLSVLFYGASGTGKTMAAEVLSHSLNLPMYRIDLSHIVSKYIGETEKNLERIFNAAETADCVLFFDEADAIFGKRTDVKDAHDRYANMGISYLLQRLETFNGLAILATNRCRDLDESFTRRLHSMIEFPIPGKKERQKIWEKVFQAVDTSELDMAYLAQKFKLTGGHIRSIALNACLTSMINEQPDAPGKVTMEDTLRAVKKALK